MPCMRRKLKSCRKLAKPHSRAHGTYASLCYYRRACLVPTSLVPEASLSSNDLEEGGASKVLERRKRTGVSRLGRVRDDDDAGTNGF
mmetsp:Transcript_5508/g.10818  ORF Transcript_5508/g.10818 Transcript_5508/m.10818 type:complete len:87 (-) Transcript_5508:2298-2558(-)